MNIKSFLPAKRIGPLILVSEGFLPGQDLRAQYDEWSCHHKSVVYLHPWPTLELSPCNSNPLNCTQTRDLKTILSTSSKRYKETRSVKQRVEKSIRGIRLPAGKAWWVLDITQQCGLASQRAIHALSCNQSSVGSRGRRGFCPSALLRSH